jgi:hypothetical protein
MLGQPLRGLGNALVGHAQDQVMLVPVAPFHQPGRQMRGQQVADELDHLVGQPSGMKRNRPPRLGREQAGNALCPQLADGQIGVLAIAGGNVETGAVHILARHRQDG